MYTKLCLSVKFALDALNFFRKMDTKLLRNLSDKILIEGFIGKDNELIKLSIVVHSLSKICEKDYYKKDGVYWKTFVDKIQLNLEEIANDKLQVSLLEKIIIELDEHFGRYKNNVLHRSKIRKGSTLYAWGVSLTLASQMVKVQEIELMKQIGRTKIVDEENQIKVISERLKDAEEIL